MAPAHFFTDGGLDLVLGAPGEAGGGVYIIPLAGLPPKTDLSAAAPPNTLVVVDDTPTGNIGQTLAVGDLDGDSFDEVAIGSPSSGPKLGSVYLVHGGATTGGMTRVSSLASLGGFLANGDSYSGFGGSLAIAASGPTGAPVVAVGASQAGVVYLVPPSAFAAPPTSPTVEPSGYQLKLSGPAGALFGAALRFTPLATQSTPALLVRAGAAGGPETDYLLRGSDLQAASKALALAQLTPVLTILNAPGPSDPLDALVAGPFDLDFPMNQVVFTGAASANNKQGVAYAVRSPE
jgi:hypothetical protein